MLQDLQMVTVNARIMLGLSITFDIIVYVNAGFRSLKKFVNRNLLVNASFVRY